MLLIDNRLNSMVDQARRISGLMNLSGRNRGLRTDDAMGALSSGSRAVSSLKLVHRFT